MLAALYLAWLACSGLPSARAAEPAPSAGGQPVTTASAARPPNIVMVFMDTLRADHVHCYGYDRPTSPNLDRLARQGTLFENAVSQASFSLPSYATVFTSLYPSQHGMLESWKKLAPAAQTLAQVVAANGYRTAAFVGGGHLMPQYGLDRGFETYKSIGDFSSLFWTVPAALGWLDSRGADDKPFFLFVHGYDVHGPYGPPLGFAEMYDPGYEGVVHDTGFLNLEVLERMHELHYDSARLDQFRDSHFQQPGMPWRARRLLPDFSTGLTDRDAADACAEPDRGEAPPAPRIGPGGLPYRLPPEPVPMSPADVRHVTAHYDGALNYADMWLGIFLDGLEKKGLLENSVVLVAGDHGEALGDHGRFGHGFELGEFTLHVPLVVSGPGIARDRRVGEVVELADLAPTALDLAGMVPCHSHRGRSLRRHLHDPEPPFDPERAAFSLSVDEASIRTRDWFLYRHLSKRGGEVIEEYKLYDVQRDEAETSDLASARPEVTARLKSRLLDWLEQTAPRSMGPKQKSTFDRAKKQLLRMFGYW